MRAEHYVRLAEPERWDRFYTRIDSQCDKHGMTLQDAHAAWAMGLVAFVKRRSKARATKSETGGVK